MIRFSHSKAGAMFLKGLFAIAVLAAGVLLSASFVLETTDESAVQRPEGEKTLALAPISLGNSATAAALTFRLPDALIDLLGDDQPRQYAVTITARPGDNLGRMLRNAGLSDADKNNVIQALKKQFRPERIRAGQKIELHFQADPERLGDSSQTTGGEFRELHMSPDFINNIIVARGEDGNFMASREKLVLTRKLARAENDIDLSLSMAAGKADVPASIQSEMIRLYSWDVDFQRDIRQGDSFELMYERFYNEDGEQTHNGDVVYAAMTLSGKRKAVYRHTLADGTVDYFDDRGASAKKALMRTPIDGARLSSGFGKRRHPILGYTKMHKGLDFAAPRGTPIYAAGNGTVEHAGRNGAYGNYVRIRHNAEYSTAYAHMKAVKTRKGRRVKQGQVIGFVGTTGRSTGPHLHYEIIRNRTQVNPFKVKMPSGRKLKGRELAAFQTARNAIRRQYAEQAEPVKLAAN
ncbi:MAG: M23 family metallopeptidase [Alphaproteobacteria bacterium]